MRFAGIIFLTIGVLLCTTITWAGIGFVAMSFGLIFFCIAEERTKAAAKLSTLSGIEPKPVLARLSEKDEVSRKSDNWSSRVEDDEDISRIVNTLTPFGQKYVDQFSRTYLIFNDKACLPIILDMIITSARNSADQVAAAGSLGEAAGPTATGFDRVSDNLAVRNGPAAEMGRSKDGQAIDKGSIKDNGSIKASLLAIEPNLVGSPKAVHELDELKLLLGRIISTAKEIQ